MEDRDRENDDQKLEFRGMGAGAEAAQGKWENFWYYNKWKVIIGVFLAVMIGVCIFQLIDRDSPDIYVMYAGPEYLTAGDVQSVRDSFRRVIDDYNGDGERGVSLMILTCLTDEQIEERREAAAAESVEFFLDKQANLQNIKQFDMEIFGGESVICLLDPSLYERVREAGGFIRMDDIFNEEELSEFELYDSCGIKFSSLPFAQVYGVFRDLPDDTVFCIRKVSTISVFKGKKKYEKLHEQHVDAFRNMVTFDYPPEFQLPESVKTSD